MLFSLDMFYVCFEVRFEDSTQFEVPNEADLVFDIFRPGVRAERLLAP